jgi:PTH2 family peptidyl-tRNA hydrolase
MRRGTTQFSQPANRAAGSGAAARGDGDYDGSVSIAAPRLAKQVIVMRKDLGMRKGKMIAQGAHASLKVLLDAGARDPDGATFTLALDPAMSAWLGGRFTKVCVSVDSEAALEAVVERARAAGVPCALIVDAGTTEFHGVPTKTCCAVGPAWTDAVDAITGELPLL